MAENATGFWPVYDGWLHQQIEALQGFGWPGALIGNLIEAPYNIAYALTHPGLWLDWSNNASVMRFAYFGGSRELLWVFVFLLLALTGLGLWRRSIMWGTVRGIEWVTNGIGRLAAWAALLMVLQQILIVFLGSVFAVPAISLGLGIPITFDMSWWSEGLKFFNAMIVALCVGYTFVQGGHVRVDLLYSPASYRTKKIIDIVGSVIFMLPGAMLVWMYGWFFLWRHLIVPKISASDSLDRLMAKSRALRWNIETTAFNANGFNAYFLFKVLMVSFTALVMLQAIAFAYRSYLELREGPEAEGKYSDADGEDSTEAAMSAGADRA